MDILLNYFRGDDLAATTWQNKYALKDLMGKILENIPEDMHRRMAKRFAEADLRYERFGTPTHSLSHYGRHRETLNEDIIFSFFDKFKYIIPQGSIMEMLGNIYKIGSLSNCFVVGQPYDSYGGIMQKDEELVQLMKRRGGVGVDISTLRPSTTLVSNAAGTSTGAVSFMDRYSNTTREVAQEGRRGALMITLDVRHPDVLDFIVKKRDLNKVTGANVSILNRDDFMEAVNMDGDYYLRYPVNYEIPSNIVNYNFEYNKLKKFIDNKGEKVYIRRVRAKEIFDELVESNWLSAEPGNIYIDRHWNYSPDAVYSIYKGITTNPCGEILMAIYDACRLIALNLFSFVINPFTDEARIDYDLLYKMAYEAQILADDLVDLELEHIDAILDKINHDPEPWEVKRTEFDLWTKIRTVASKGRRTGVGITGLGDMLAALGVKYDSGDALEIIQAVMKEKMRGELDATIDMAILRGPFFGWDSNLEYTRMENGSIWGRNDFFEFLKDEFPEQAIRMYKYGRRNVSWSTVAPTGTVSMMTQTTSGLEPIYSLRPYIRRRKINPNDTNARVDFTDDLGDKWQHFAVIHPKFIDYLDIAHNSEEANEIVRLYYNKESEDDEQRLVIMVNEFLDQNETPWDGSTAEEIDWHMRVIIQGLIQQYTTHSISSTINLPNDVSPETIAEIYMEAWKQGLKGVTVYRDGSRAGVMVSMDQDDNKVEGFHYHDAPKRPEVLPADFYVRNSRGKKYAVIIGLMDGKPYEVFAFENPTYGENTHGEIRKVQKNVYCFTSPQYDIENLQLSNEHADEILVCRMASMLLRHGAKPQYVIEQIEKSPLSIVSFGKAIAKVLSGYIEDGTTSKEVCHVCGGHHVIYEEGCKKCLDCGASKCG